MFSGRSVAGRVFAELNVVALLSIIVVVINTQKLNLFQYLLHLYPESKRSSTCVTSRDFSSERVINTIRIYSVHSLVFIVDIHG